MTLTQLPEPEPGPDELLVKTISIGVCGTDREMVAGQHAIAPQGESQLVLGHESLGIVLRAPKDSQFAAGERVVGVVRRPDPVPCASCAAGEWDMCQNGRFLERGIKGMHGYASDRFALREHFAIRVPAALGSAAVLLEPASVVAKAWEQIEGVAERMRAYEPRNTLVTGAGPIGLLAALMATQRGHEVHVFDRARQGIKPALVRQLGASYCSDLAQLKAAPQIVLECTGAGQVVLDTLGALARNGIVCLTGLSSGARVVELSATRLNDRLVLENEVLLGSVNANRRHYQAALSALERAPMRWLDSLIQRRVPITRYAEAFERRPDDVKVVLDWED